MNSGWRGAFLWPWLALIAIGCAVYAATLRAFFVADDFTLVRAVAEHGPFAVWSGPLALAPIFFRPLTSLTFYIDYRLYGLRASGYHLTNVLLHCTSAWLVGRIALVTCRQRPLVAATAALLFLVGPAHGESVAWIAGRTDVVATVFGLGAFVCYLHAIESQEWRWPALAFALYVLGLGAKESLVALPLVALAYQALVVQTWRGRGARLVIAFLVCLPPYILVRRWAVGGWVGGYGASAHLHHDPRYLLVNGTQQLLHALGFGVPSYGSWLTLALYVVLGCASLAALVAWHVDRRSSRASQPQLLLFLLVAIAISMLPTLNLAIATAGTEGERYVYLATVWLSLLLAIVVAPAFERPQRLVVAGALVASGALLLAVRNVRWRDAGALSREVVATIVAQPLGSEPLTLLNVPDSLRDAYIMHTGIWDAQLLFAPKGPPLYVGAYEPLDTPDEPVDVERRGDNLTLTLPAAARRLGYWSPPPADAPFHVLEQSARRFVVMLPPSRRALAFVHGALRSID